MTFQELADTLSQYLDAKTIASIATAYELAANAHQQQTRFSGEPYITHPVAVAHVLAEMRMDPESIMAAILHDVIEDTTITKADLAKKFGDNVAELVDGVSKLAHIPFENRALAQAENFRKMLLAMVKDIRVIIIKLADRLHNMRTIGPLPFEKKRRIALETLEIYAPIANRLGMHHFYVELEDLSFAALNPMRHYLLKKAVRTAHGQRHDMMHTIKNAIATTLTQGHVSHFHIEGRQKHLYSIYRKMRQKHLSFHDIMDVYAFRIIVGSIDDCYRTLGLVHHLYKPVPNRFKDYIAIPKANSYQSLHTTLFGPRGMPIEIQIRTQEMSKIADNGIAAHWLYKTPGGGFDKVQERTRTWLLHLLEIQKETGNSIEFIENVKIDLFPRTVFVFTPKGDILELPQKATPVDFAYAIHTDVGNHCVAARINRHLAPLSTPLANGQTVEIIVDPKSKPNPAWLTFVVSSKARGFIRSFLNEQKQSNMITLGKRLLHTSLETLPKTEIIETFLHQTNLASLEDLYESIGRGERDSVLVARQLLHEQEQKNIQKSLSIKGTEGILIQYAKCCWPIPGDPIMAVLLPEEGLMIHAEGCQEMEKMRHKANIHLIPVEWSAHPEGEYQVRLDVELKNEKGALAALAQAIATTGANIVHIVSDNIDFYYARISFILMVHDRDHLARMMRHMRRIKSVFKISRFR